MAEVAAKEVAALNEVAEVEAMPNEVAELAATGSSAVVIRVVGVDSVAASHLGSRQAARHAAMPARRVSVVVPAVLAPGRVPGRKARDARETAPVELENRVQPPELRHRIVTILSTPARKAPPQVLLLPIVTIPSTRVRRVQPPALRHRIVTILSTPARKAPPQVLLFPIVIIPSTRVRRVQPPALPLLTAISRSTRVLAA